MADAELVAAGFLNQIAGTREFEPIFLLIEQQQTVQRRHGILKELGQLSNRLGEFFERNVESDFGIRRIDERLDFQGLRWKGAVARDFLETRKSVGERG